ncbi:hypothetical protein F53441_811 [Fusarium austroafricanum]|uniref:BTB domain-containing protein n=1 Tax=Fusarium austroafricanum TaxID=2364996 RepID=A0A8H4PE55_9HYPO|nr:hypothetical protein F53441_811 [Fusarium austroafricanum]
MFDDTFFQRLQKAREAGKNTDFAFTCHGKTIPVHKIIISAHSDVFDAACNGKFKEALTGTYDISEHPLEIVEGMVEYMYTGDYSVSADAPLSTHAVMLSVADKYIIPGLQKKSLSNYLDCLREFEVDISEDDDDLFEDFIDSVPKLYAIPLHVSQRARDGAMIFARMELFLDTWLTGSERTIEELFGVCPEFIKDLLFFMLRFKNVKKCQMDRCRQWGENGASCMFCGLGTWQLSLQFDDWQRLLDVLRRED